MYDAYMEVKALCTRSCVRHQEMGSANIMSNGDTVVLRKRLAEFEKEGDTTESHRSLPEDELETHI